MAVYFMCKLASQLFHKHLLIILRARQSVRNETPSKTRHPHLYYQ